ncbi:uncharacterized protein LOC121988463 [Zingiber officinale]|uniref:B30.2/SPRY domain-containing protein n=1 Tax=Zingiber officinale TaxID=94328 RepID=A0A8J5FXD4_ZINOF|nr:uncharacterized protein LOC121988463 [Zingiber officinale]KAG6496878.1 hypothetical protein ZIOFF_044753 [Zingiber officinale]
MRVWIKILLPAIAAALLLVILLLWRRRLRRRFPSPPDAAPRLPQSASKVRSQSLSLHAGIAKLQFPYRSSTGRKPSFFSNHFHHDYESAGQAPVQFNWDEHPRLVVEAVEHGWSRFVFAGGRPPDAAAPGAWGMCAACDNGGTVETNWEVPPGASEFSQTVRLHPRGRRSSMSSPLALHREGGTATSRMLLPLPGPPLGVSSFPQEAYLEITVLYLKPPPPPPSRTNKRTKPTDAEKETDRAKLIAENSNSFEFQSIHPSATDQIDRPIQEANAHTKEEEGNQSQNATLSLGLAHGGTLPSGSFSGTYPGSIGFHSNGSVYLDGKKLIFESEKAEWAEANRVIGCGFDPRKKKVFFTVDSKLMHVIHCHSDMYKAPLFPILGSNTDAMVLVNLGQSRFKYEPANAHRTPNPCFIRSSSVDYGAAAISDDDSRELFSMGRIDAQWFDAAKKSQSGTKKSNANHESSYAVDVDADSDLFEISLHI